MNQGWGAVANHAPSTQSHQAAANNNYDVSDPYANMRPVPVPDHSLTASSLIGKEFGLTNKRNQFNCFLNVVLQSIWVYPSLRTGIQSLCDLRTGGP